MCVSVLLIQNLSSLTCQTLQICRSTTSHIYDFKPHSFSIYIDSTISHRCTFQRIFKLKKKITQRPAFSPFPTLESMVRKRFQDAKTGLHVAKSFGAEKYLKKIGLGKEDYYFWKQIGKGLLCTYTICGVAWLYNDTSPLGWWTLKPRPKEEKELAHLYERREFPYPGDEEAMREFIEKGGMIGTTIGPKGVIETDKDSLNYQKQLQDNKFEQEALKLWLRMRNEVVSELQEKGYDVE